MSDRMDARDKKATIEHDQMQKVGPEQQGMMLSLNAGSSSLKFKLYASTDADALLAGSVKLLDTGATLAIQHSGGVYSEVQDWDRVGSDAVLSHLLSLFARLHPGALDIRTVVHRVVHGAHLASGVSITRADTHLLRTLELLAWAAPLHNAVAVALIRACLASPLLPADHTNVCCFDAAFHRDLDEVRNSYMLDGDLVGHLPEGTELRKWGFHGISYASTLGTLAATMDVDRKDINAILCHLGAGSSVCAVVHGRSFDTSMGWTPLEGLPGTTRSGSIDPALPLHIPRAAEMVETLQGVRVTRAESVLNEHSGFVAVAGTSDFAAISRRRADVVHGITMSKPSAGERDSDRRAALAFDVFVDRLVGLIGGYAAKMGVRGGVHALVFAGGIGEASNDLRGEVARLLDATPLSADDVGTTDRGECRQLSRSELGLGTRHRGEGVRWFVCRTDEEREMAREVWAAQARTA